MSQSISVKKVSNEELSFEYATLQNTFSKVEFNNIVNSPWKEEFPYSPIVSFQILHSSQFIALHYVVEEEFVRAQAIRPNESVWEDSCVEFFVSLDNKKTYYNFEFNVLGTGLIGYGSSVKSERNRLSAGQIETVNTLTFVKKQNGSKAWEIFLLIPKDLISLGDEGNKVIHANFYKCGDALPNPHFIAWSNIDNPKPNFHLPQFFGELILE